MERPAIDPKKGTAKRLGFFALHCVLALRTNIARHLKGMDHREFCIHLADSHLFQWFLQIGRAEGVKAFAKTTSDSFARLIDEASLPGINTLVLCSRVEFQGPYTKGNTP